MATGATRSSHLAVVNASTERNHICRRSFGNRKIFSVTLRRLGGRSHDFASRSRNARAGSALGFSARGIARVDDPINPPANVVRNVKRTVGSDCEPRRAVRSSLRSFYRPSETVGEDLAVAGGAIALERLKHYVVPALRIGRSIP